jgi:hypothetical protein
MEQRFIITNVSINTYEENNKHFIDARVTLVWHYEPWQLRMEGSERKTIAIDNIGNLFLIETASIGQHTIIYVIRNASKCTSLQIGNQFTLTSEKEEEK